MITREEIIEAINTSKFDSFNHCLAVVCDALTNVLNSDVCQVMIDRLRADYINKSGVNATPEGWKEIKQQFYIYMFNQVVKEYPELKSKLAESLYNDV